MKRETQNPIFSRLGPAARSLSRTARPGRAAFFSFEESPMTISLFDGAEDRAARPRQTSAARRSPRPAPTVPRRQVDLPAADGRNLWPADMRPLIDFLEFAAPELVAAPFHFKPGEFVIEPAGFLAALRRDVAAGPDGPRAGPLQADLERLRELFGRRVTSGTSL